jgi:putative zinc finger protein
LSEQDLELERLRRAFAARDGTASGGCPEAERIWSAARGELPPEEVRPLVAHLLDCAACAEAWRLAREMDAPAAVGSAGVSAAPPSRRWGWWGTLAAAILVGALASVLLPWRPGPDPGFRDGPSAQIRSLLPDAEPLPRGRFLLRWSAGAENATYSVQVATERLEPIAEARGLSATEYLVPPDKLASLPGGSTVLWRVEAVSPGGARLGSATFVSRLE